VLSSVFVLQPVFVVFFRILHKNHNTAVVGISAVSVGITFKLQHVFFCRFVFLKIFHDTVVVAEMISEFLQGIVFMLHDASCMLCCK